MININDNYSFTDLKEKVWICEKLGLYQGSLNILCGKGNAGKTMLAQYLASCACVGVDLLGKYPVSKSRVLHLDLEQSKEQTITRYLRLRNGLNIRSGFNISLSALDRIPVVNSGNYARVYEALVSIFKDYNLIIIDSLKALTEADENGGNIEPILKMIKRIASELGICILIIHHKGKYANGATQSGRGHSSIYDTVDVQLDLDKNRKGHCLSWAKGRDRKLGEDFSYTIDDGGEYNAHRKCQERLVFTDITSADCKVGDENYETNILKSLKEEGKGNVSQLVRRIRCDRAGLISTLSSMCEAKLVEFKTGPKNSKIYEVTPFGEKTLSIRTDGI